MQASHSSALITRSRLWATAAVQLRNRSRVLVGDAEHLAEHRHRQRVGEVGDGSIEPCGASSSRRGTDALLTDRRSCSMARGPNGGCKELAQAGVVGVVAQHERGAPRGVGHLGRRDVPRRRPRRTSARSSSLLMVWSRSTRDHVGVAGQHPPDNRSDQCTGSSSRQHAGTGRRARWRSPARTGRTGVTTSIGQRARPSTDRSATAAPVIRCARPTCRGRFRRSGRGRRGCGPTRSASGAERVDVEAVDLGRVEPEHRGRLVDGDVAEGVAQPLARVGPGALGMGEVVAPHDVADADLVAAGQLAPAGVRRADGAVAVEVLARPHATGRR